LASGQTFVDDWYITCYNLVFTALPLCISAITDSDIDLKESKANKKNFALLYKENRDTHRIFSFFGFVRATSKGMLMSIIIFITCSFNEILNIKGHYGSIWYLSLKNYICVLVLVSLNLLISNNFLAYLLPLSIGITTFLLFIIFLVLNHYGFLFQFNSKASIFPSLSSPLTYFTVIFISSLGFIFDYTYKLVNILITRRLSYWLLINRATKTKKNSFDVSRVQSFKPYRKATAAQKRYSVPFKEVSRNFLLQKAPSFLDRINKENNKNELEFKFQEKEIIKQ
jgi:magnesium-transporting ATPase (P-type)